MFMCNESNNKSTISLNEYEKLTKETDRFFDEDITPIVFGLFGEVGSAMTASKKYRREKKAYTGYKEALKEEFGDTLWYFTALCRRLNISLESVFCSIIELPNTKILSASNHGNAPIAQSISFSDVLLPDAELLELGCIAGKLLHASKDKSSIREILTEFAHVYIKAIQSSDLSFAKIIQGNLSKTRDRFTKSDPQNLPDFDATFSEEEQLPRKFEIFITQRKNGQCYLRWNGVFIGQPLTDNISDPDGYRFHDVFHLAYATILHWSPTFRALIKHKRKSNPWVDETEDGGRAIVVEEGLTAWLFSYSKDLDFFQGHDRVSLDVLKTIKKFVRGYEVESCPLSLWEQAILRGYEIFRQVKENNGGIIKGDRNSRTITYHPLGDKFES